METNFPSKDSCSDYLKTVSEIIMPGILLIIIFSGCSSTRILSNPDKTRETENDQGIASLNYLGSVYSSEVFLSNQNSIDCFYINLNEDTLNIIRKEGNLSEKISADQVEKIIIKDHTASCMGGLWTGMGSGLLTFFVYTLAFDCGACHPNYGSLVAGTAAIGIGFLGGYLFTGERVFVFNPSQE